jgi:hypothetical protein
MAMRSRISQSFRSPRAVLVVASLFLALAGLVSLAQQGSTLTGREHASFPPLSGVSSSFETIANPSPSASSEQDSGVAVLSTTSINDPGIVVTSPKANALVQFPLRVEGYITEQGWGVNEGEAGNAIVLDAMGKVISTPAVLMTTTDWLVLPTSFEATVGDRETMVHIQTATGFVRLNSRGDKDTDYIKAISIPVRFRSSAH